MKIGPKVLWIGIAVLLTQGCRPAQKSAPEDQDTQSALGTVDDSLVQFSLLSALAADNYTVAHRSAAYSSAVTLASAHSIALTEK